ncbi:hypothetical protein GCM10011571_16930 [Marinithermofilum abyssi]|uniref:DNA2/NAM7 helicase-like C-terminal domain-containing protein n=1 Tax=Marinithermofilum abyssi TaxID=1571185 RepID=A0A8J2YCH2_9BACL|nr:hypothetical protein GCM10011571_16930 [Marinithermofilum abyssi]
MVPKQGSGPHRELIELYESLLSSENMPTLLKNYLSLEAEKKDDLLKSSFTHSDRHVGQMNDKYPLSSGQRKALHHFFSLNQGEMLAVNGPPGTGKTSLIQNVIASLWVEAAAKESNHPPVMVVTSTNNKAITNVIESFGKIGEKVSKKGTVWAKKTERLKGRWIPGLQSYALYFPSNTQLMKLNRQEREQYQIVSEKGENFMEGLEAAGRLPELEAHFLKEFSAYQGHTVNSVEEAVKLLNKELNEVCSAIHEGLLISFKHQDHQDLLKQEFNNSIEDLQSKVTKWKEQAVKARELKSVFSDLKTKWNEYQNREPLWWKWLIFLPGMNNRILRRNESFALQHSEWIQVTSYSADEVTAAIDRSLQKHTKEECIAVEKHRELKDLSKEIHETERRLHQWNDQYQIRADKILSELDTSLRFLAFQLATHYWEGRWLLEMKKPLHKSKSPSNLKKQWHRYAKLTPCMVSTVYKIPKWFCGYKPKERGKGTDPDYLTEFIDLLIIDEAGQVSPELAAPSFALAKNALVIGDVMQIEPVSNITRAVDRGNLFGCNVVNDEETVVEMEDKGMTVTTGSVMKIAQRRSKYQVVENFGGMFLAEHYRCLREIINYCNVLAYDGELEPSRDSACKYNFLPALGYAHIEGTVEKASRSGKFNILEAEAIARWVKENAKQIEHTSEKKIGESLGIVTPFRYQAALIRQFLKELGFRNITVGTVHALQGAERDIILFSPVEGGANPFYDNNLNLLNVAVSRAKDSFLIFGNMNTFGTVPGKPSNILRSFVYKKENEIHIFSRESGLLEKVEKRLKRKFDLTERNDRTIIQHIVNIQKNEGQIFLTSKEVSATMYKEEKQMNDNRVQYSGNINISGGQNNLGSGNQYNQSSANLEEMEKLKAKLNQLLLELKKTNELHKAEQQAALDDLEDVIDRLETGDIKEGTLRRLNRKLKELDGLVLAGSGLSQSIASVMGILDLVMK